MSKGFFPISAQAEMGQLPYMQQRDLDAFVRGLQIAMDQEGWRAAPLSEAAGLGTTAVRDLFRKASSPKVSTAYALASVLGRTVDDLIALGMNDGGESYAARAIAVAGKVGAGASVDLVDAHEKGDGLYLVACPPQLSPHGMVAVEVEGDSMAPTYSPGTVLFYSRQALGIPTEAIGRICVCEDADGKGWVKVIKLGVTEGTFSLISLNPEAGNLHGVQLKWAAPVKFSLPKEFIKKL
jgi:transcriptional regulator with XRE-family HTH domain